MAMSNKRWQTVTPSEFPWEREALDYVREELPDHEPYFAFSNFEFIAEDGSINEVDLLVVSPSGFFLVEIKSWSGKIRGDAGTWVWESKDKVKSVDNPIFLANKKAKRLAGLLKKQRAFQKAKIPFLESLIFLSATDLKCSLPESLRQHVFLRDVESGNHLEEEQTGIISALRGGVGSRTARQFRRIDKPTANVICRAIDQAGIRPRANSRKVGEYVLGELLYESPTGTYQDFEATHAAVKESRRRIRLYNVAPGASQLDRGTVRTAAYREFGILERLSHPGILQVGDCHDHELGTALIFPYDANAVRLDHYLNQNHAALNIDVRLNLVRQIAEALKHAHEKKVLHRALSPQSILVSDPLSSEPKIKIYNWQTSHRVRESESFSSVQTLTRHLGDFVEEAASVYLAPEVIEGDELYGEYIDIFSLGAIAYLVFSGQPPAANRVELTQRLMVDKKLLISSVMDGAPEELQSMVEDSTAAEVRSRIDSVEFFLDHLNDLEEALTDPDSDALTNPLQAKAGDRLLHGFTVKRRLGSGASAIVFLVERDGKQQVLKVARAPEHSDRLRLEAESIQKLRHHGIVEIYEQFEFENLAAFTMELAGEKTLAQRIREEGRLSLEMLERFGEDLLELMRHLEREGIYHRDIKPENIGVVPMRRGDALHLLLFDFSLTSASLENIRAGTPPYLDPFLKQRKPSRYDAYAERFAVAMTIHEMATGMLPRWGDDKSDPAMVEEEVTLSSELFDPVVRDKLSAFLSKSLSRSINDRFDNADEMLRSWRDLFADLEKISSFVGDEDTVAENRKNASLQTELILLGLSSRALNALERLNILRVEELLRYPLRKIYRLPGVGTQSRKEIAELVRELKLRLPDIGNDIKSALEDTKKFETQLGEEDADEPQVSSIDLIVAQIATPRGKTRGDAQLKLSNLILGIEHATQKAPTWKSQAEAARELGISTASVSITFSKLRDRWKKNKSVTSLREFIIECLERAGGVMEKGELVEALLEARGSSADEPRRSILGSAALRVAVEVEKSIKEARFFEQRKDEVIFVTSDSALAEIARKLGEAADSLASSSVPLSSFRAIEEIKVLSGTYSVNMSDDRILRLAVASSSKAALSPRLEVYLKGLPAERAILLSAGALMGTKELTIDSIERRVRSRYPECAPLPSRPELDEAIAQAVPGLVWESTAGKGKGAYRAPEDREFTSSTNSSYRSRQKTAYVDGAVGEAISEEVADASLLEKRLGKLETEGAFFVLSVSPSRMRPLITEVTRRFNVKEVNLDKLLTNQMRREAEIRRVDWNVVVKTDATGPEAREWRNLMTLVNAAVVVVEEELSNSEQTILLTHPGLLARFNKISLIENLRDKVNVPPRSLHGLWVVIPCDGQAPQPALNQQAVPVIGPGQWVRVPKAWIANEHRAAGL